ncbi:MAG: cupredoxin domain-containing protein, partial [Dehalococcoidia bacterium]
MKSKAPAILASIIAAALVALVAVVLLSRGGTSTTAGNTAPTNVSIVGGNQLIEIGAKGGFSPRNTTAKADTPTTLKIKTNGTYDCSSSVNIPKLGYRTSLPPTGETAVNVP